MNSVRHAVIVLLFLSAAGIASAQVLEISASGGPNLLSNRTLAVDSAFGQVDLKNGFQIAFRMTLNAYRYMGHEVGYAYNRTNLLIGDGTIHGMAAHQGLYDLLVYARPEGAKIRPFIAGGGQFSNFIFPGGSVTSGGSGQMKFGVNYGFGVKVRVTEKWLIRADFRQYATPKPDFAELGATTAPQGWLKMNAITAGVGFTL